LRKTVEILNAPQQGLAAMQDDRKIDERVSGDMLFDALHQLTQHAGTHQLRLVVDGRVAEPVAIGAIDVASGCHLDQQLRDRLVLKGGGI
jgi:hypothetical protein